MELEAIDLNKDAIRWFPSYLVDPQQLVDVSSTLSSSTEIKCDVPQRSILEPLLFLIYVIDMSGVVNNKLLLCAVDSDKHKSNIE